MTIDCCDGSQLPATEGTKGAKSTIQRPNSIQRVPASTWTPFTVPKPSYVLLTTTAGATVQFYPGLLQGNPATLAETYRPFMLTSTTFIFYAHAPGQWMVHSDQVITSFVLFDSYDGVWPLILALKAVGATITGGASGAVADVRDADDGSADWAAALLGLVVNSRPAVFQSAGNVYQKWFGGDPNTLVGKGYGSNDVVGGNVNAYQFGRDTTAGGNGVAAPVEVRDAAADGDGAKALLAALANTRPFALDSVADEYKRQIGAPVNNLAGLPVAGIVPAVASFPVALRTDNSNPAAGTCIPDTSGGIFEDCDLGVGLNVNARRSTAKQCVTATGVNGAAVTATIPAHGSAGFHQLITHIEITKFFCVAGAAGGAPDVVTSTNLTGNPAWSFPTGGIAGSVWDKRVEPESSIRSDTANTATTIVCPAVADVIWRVTVWYYYSNM